MKFVSPEEMKTNHGPIREAGQASWYTIMHRNGKIPGVFERNGWAGYQKGFGSLANNGNFWVGLDKLNKWTSQGKWNLVVKLRSLLKGSAVMYFRNFRVGSSLDNYPVTIGPCYRFLGEQYLKDKIHRIRGINGEMFTTKDAPNESRAKINLSRYFNNVGFWYNGKSLYPLTGPYFIDALMAIRKVA